ncbi:hypothetical protein V8C26DRAFT_55737 [Trichoderma gracile]
MRILFEGKLEVLDSYIERHLQDEMPKEESTIALVLTMVDGLFGRTPFNELRHDISSSAARTEWNGQEVIKWVYSAESFRDLGRKQYLQALPRKPFNPDPHAWQSAHRDIPHMSGWTQNVACIDRPNELSDRDKILIQRFYRSNERTTECRSFDTQEEGEKKKPQSHHLKSIPLQNPDDKALDLMPILTEFDLQCYYEL